MADDKIKERQEEIINLVTNFCNDELNDEYKNLAVSLVEKMGEKEDVPFKRGKLEIWASTIIYALGQINSLFDESSKPYKSADDICNYFETKKATVSQKAKTIGDMVDLDEFSIKNSDSNDDSSEMVEDSKDQPKEVEELLEKVIAKDIEGNDLNNDHFNYHSGFTTLKEFEEAIAEFKEMKGEEYFEENKGAFWGLPETRPFMQDLFDYASLLWESGQKERAIENLEYILELNPGDNMGARDFLVNYLINLNKLEDAQKLIDRYPEDIVANWNYSKLLIAIKNKESMKKIQELFDEAYSKNYYVLDYILKKRQLDEIPSYYGVGDENEAKAYIYLANNNWNDKKTLKTLKKVMKK